MTAAALLTLAGNAQTAPTTNIGKSDITVENKLMTPEALWAMGRIATATASPDGKQIAYQVGYYSVKENKGHQVLCLIDANGKNNRQLTTAATSETDPAWIEQGQRIAYISEGEIWAMNADGSGRKQLSESGGSIEGFKFSPDGKKVILIKSIPYNDIIKKNPDDLPLATGRLATDLMYRHWDHYVESIQHPFVADVTGNGITEGEDIMKGEPYECPMAPFGGIEQLNWSPDSRQIAYTCRKKTGLAYAISTDSDIYLYDTETKTTTNLCKPAGYKPVAVDPTRSMKGQAVNSEENLKNNPGYDTNPQFSAPTGKYICMAKAWRATGMRPTATASAYTTGPQERRHTLPRVSTQTSTPSAGTPTRRHCRSPECGTAASTFTRPTSRARCAR